MRIQKSQKATKVCALSSVDACAHAQLSLFLRVWSGSGPGTAAVGGLAIAQDAHYQKPM